VGRAFPAVNFGCLSVECPFNNSTELIAHKLGAKLLRRFSHRRRQVLPAVNNATHRLFDRSQHFLDSNFK
jgi:hypothetical protein